MRAHNIGLSIASMLIDVDLCINAVDIKIWGHSPWVDLNLGSIDLHKHIVKLLQLFNSLIARLSSKFKIIDDLLSQL